MTREPLMLSDTAMVLLRRFIDLLGHKERSISEYHQVVGELLVDIWLVWTFPDIPLVRHLDWHLVFDEKLMRLAEKAFISSEEHSMLWLSRRRPSAVTKKAVHVNWLLQDLWLAYKASNPVTQTKTTL